VAALDLTRRSEVPTETYTAQFKEKEYVVEGTMAFDFAAERTTSGMAHRPSSQTFLPAWEYRAQLSATQPISMDIEILCPWHDPDVPKGRAKFCRLVNCLQSDL
jgi:hypothetical protein